MFLNTFHVLRFLPNYSNLLECKEILSLYIQSFVVLKIASIIRKLRHCMSDLHSEKIRAFYLSAVGLIEVFKTFLSSIMLCSGSHTSNKLETLY